MAAFPRLDIDLDVIRENTASLVARCRLHGIAAVGVTKAACGSPEIAQAMLDGGAQAIGDSRLANLRRLALAGIRAPLMLLRVAMLEEAAEIVRLAEFSLQSEIATVEALGREALEAGKRHKVILMVDVGDLREGVLPEEAFAAARAMAKIPGIAFWGLGTNLGCFSGILPTASNTGVLTRLARCLEAELGYRLPVVSGGSTASLHLLDEGWLPEGVNQLRLGEGLLLGTDVTRQARVLGTQRHGFILRASLVEVKEKPSLPEGPTGRDSFGFHRYFSDRGVRRRAIAALGRQDFGTGELEPLESGVEVLGASSDHLILDLTNTGKRLAVGDVVSFILDYPALVALSTSPYVRKVYWKGGRILKEETGLRPAAARSAGAGQAGMGRW